MQMIDELTEERKDKELKIRSSGLKARKQLFGKEKVINCIKT